MDVCNLNAVTHRGQRCHIPLELEVQAVVTGLTGVPGIELKSPGRAVHALDFYLSSSLKVGFKPILGSFKVCNVVSALLGFSFGEASLTQETSVSKAVYKETLKTEGEDEVSHTLRGEKTEDWSILDSPGQGPWSKWSLDRLSRTE